MQLTPDDKKLLDRLQQGLPLEPDPLGRIAGELGLDRDELVRRIHTLQTAGYIRRLGGVWDAGKLGFHSLLVGGAVAPEDLPAVIQRVNAHPGVTHNYLRQGPLNLWFTLTTNSPSQGEAFLAKLQTDFPGCKFYPFPKVKSYKLKVFFPLEEA